MGRSADYGGTASEQHQVLRFCGRMNISNSEFPENLYGQGQFMHKLTTVMTVSQMGEKTLALLRSDMTIQVVATRASVGPATCCFESIGH